MSWARAPSGIAARTARPRPSSAGQVSEALAVIFDIGEARIVGRRPLEGAALLAWLPRHDVLDLLGELEVLVGHALGGVVHQPDLDPGIGGGEVGMVPGGLGEVTDGVDHHQRALPAVGLVAAPDPAILEPPVRQIALQAFLDLGVAVDALGWTLCHGGHSSSLTRRSLSRRLVSVADQ